MLVIREFNFACRNARLTFVHVPVVFVTLEYVLNARFNVDFLRTPFYYNRPSLQCQLSG